MRARSERTRPRRDRYRVGRSDRLRAPLADRSAHGELAFWTSDTGIDGQNPVDPDELDLLAIDPLPSYVWFQDMADFADGISDVTTGRLLAQSLQGRGAFRRFKDRVYERPNLIPAWHALRDVRAQRRAVEWLVNRGLIDEAAAQRFVIDHPDPVLP